MDPALQELLEVGEATDEVAVVVKLRDAGAAPARLRLVTRFGSVATARIQRLAIHTVYENPAIISLKAPRWYAIEYGPILDDGENAALIDTDVRRPDIPQTGRGTVVGIIDFGCDFAHPDFVDDDGGSRLIALWDQRASQGDGNAYGYGRIHDRVAIDGALQTGDPYAALAYHPAQSDTGIGAHGTHVMSIAAGNGRGGGPVGLVPKADLVFVHLGSPGWEKDGALGDSTHVLEAIDFVVKEAGDRPLVINMSIGRHSGPHDGTTLVEQAIDALLRTRPGTAIVQSTGNYFARNVHSSGRLRSGEEVVLPFEVHAGDTTPNELEVWYRGCDVFGVRLVAPNGEAVAEVPLGGKADVMVDGRRVARLYHRAHDPNNGDHHINLFQYERAPSGTWRLALHGVDVADGRYHAWLERDPGCKTCQAFFARDVSVRTTTTGSISNSFLTISVGAYDAHNPSRPIAPFSSSGPTRDGRVRPCVLAPGVRVLAARSRAVHGAAPLLTRMSGTSMAAPHVCGTIALMLETGGRLDIGEIRRLLFDSLDAVLPMSAEDEDRLGFGYLNTAAAVERVAAHAERMQDRPTDAAAAAFSPTPFLRAPVGETVADGASQEDTMDQEERITVCGDAGDLESSQFSTVEWDDPSETGPVKAWTGSAEQIEFRDRVLAAHIKRRQALKRLPQPDLRRDQLDFIPQTKILTATATAQAAGRLLQAANADLATAQQRGDEDAMRTKRITVSSGYRDRAYQESLWRRYFPGYYNRTHAAREGLADGPHSEKALTYMLTPKREGGFGLMGRIAAPGYSNHQGGIAIDFWQERDSRHTIKNASDDESRRRWQATWFHHWLEANAARFDFKPIDTEEWHWEFHPQAGKAAAPGKVGAMPSPRDYRGGKLWTFTAHTLDTETTIFCSRAALGRGDIEILVFAHGLLNVCQPGATNAAGIVDKAPFRFGEIIDRSARPLVLVVPELHWRKAERYHALGEPKHLNAFLGDVLGEVGRVAGHSVTGRRLIIAGHSRAYGFLEPLARMHAEPEMRTGALAALSHIWAFDTAYVGNPDQWAGWVQHDPRLSVEVMYRPGSSTETLGERFLARRQSRLAVTKVREDHCLVPAAHLPALLQQLPAERESADVADAALFGTDTEFAQPDDIELEATAVSHEFADPVAIGESLLEIGVLRPCEFAKSSQLQSGRVWPDHGAAWRVFDDLAGRAGATRRALAVPLFDIVGRPGGLAGPVRAGDLLIRRGEGTSAHVAMIAAPALLRDHEARAQGLTLEGPHPGFYAHVIEPGARPHMRNAQFARRVAYADGTVPRDSLVVRPHERGQEEDAEQDLLWSRPSRDDAGSSSRGSSPRAPRVCPPPFLSGNTSTKYFDYIRPETTGVAEPLINGRSSGGAGPDHDLTEPLDAMQRAVETLRAGDAVYLAAWIFEADTPLTAGTVGSATTWGAFLRDRAALGVRIRILLNDFDPILGAWATSVDRLAVRPLNRLIASLPATARDNLKYVVSMHPVKTGALRSVLATLFSSGVPVRTSINVASHHQKFMVVRKGDELTAFCGGLDIEGRKAPANWDYRGLVGWHDIHVRLAGPITRDLEREFVMRWNREKDHSTRPAQPGWRGFETLSLTPLSGAERPLSRDRLQMTRTVSDDATFSLFSNERDDIKRVYRNAIGCADQFVYMENQYFKSPELADWIVARGRARPGLIVIIVVVEDLSVDDGTNPIVSHGTYLQFKTFDGIVRGLGASRVRIYTMKGRAVHSKFLLVDDTVMSIGSANASVRSFDLDTELNVTVGSRTATRAFRHRLWAHNLGKPESSIRAWTVRDFTSEWDLVARGNARRPLPDMEGEGIVPLDYTLYPGSSSMFIPDAIARLDFGPDSGLPRVA